MQYTKGGVASIVMIIRAGYDHYGKGGPSWGGKQMVKKSCRPRSKADVFLNGFHNSGGLGSHG